MPFGRCKRLVNADKQFTIKQAPQILHIHLKRFTPTGQKISGFVHYTEKLDLAPYMSEDAPHVRLASALFVPDVMLMLPRFYSSNCHTAFMPSCVTLEAALTQGTTLLTPGLPTANGTT